MRTNPYSTAGKAQRGRERETGERGREQLEKEKERQDGHKRRLSLRPGPFLGVGWVDLPPQRRRCSVGHQDNRNARERRKSSEILNCAAVPGFKDIPETKN